MQNHSIGTASIPPAISILIVSFNTKDVLRECLESVNGGQPGSRPSKRSWWTTTRRMTLYAMIRDEFPWVQRHRERRRTSVSVAPTISRSRQARGRYIVLLNSDAFLQKPIRCALSLEKMEADHTVGLASGRLVGREGDPAALGPDVPQHLCGSWLVISGLADKISQIPFLRPGRPNLGRSHACQPRSIGFLAPIRSSLPASCHEHGFFDPTLLPLLRRSRPLPCVFRTQDSRSCTGPISAWSMWAASPRAR